MNILIVGYGEVGRSMHEVIKEKKPKWKVGYIDVDDQLIPFKGSADVMHVCINYDAGFNYKVKKYIKKYDPNLVIINSTVKVGTSRTIHNDTKANIVHVPIFGVHPKLAEGIKTFTCMIGCANLDAHSIATKYYSDLGLEYRKVDRAATTELGKLLSTTTYGIYIEWHRQLKEICDTYGVPFQIAITEFTKNYNEGYGKLDMKKFIRPILTPPKGKIGGHCINPNAKILYDEIYQIPYLRHLVQNNEIQKDE